ncbi:MAG: DUF1292 domain-containing protein [Oscillospiraceae bacterium]|nr:DUF1292 domain-containing protein [Oscillospiraceae bacterium]
MDNMDNMDYSPEIFTLTDEEGVEHEFELWDIIEADGAVYYGLIPHNEDAETIIEEDTELVILKLISENGEDVLSTIDNDEEYERIGQMFLEKSFEDDEEEEE